MRSIALLLAVALPAQAFVLTPGVEVDDVTQHIGDNISTTVYYAGDTFTASVHVLDCSDGRGVVHIDEEPVEFVLGGEFLADALADHLCNAP